MGFDLRPERGFEGGIFGALLLDDMGMGDSGGKGIVEIERDVLEVRNEDRIALIWMGNYGSV